VTSLRISGCTRCRHVDYRIYGENYYLYTRGYALIQEAFGRQRHGEEVLSADDVSGLSGGIAATPSTGLAKEYYGQADTPKDALKLLDNRRLPPLSRNFSAAIRVWSLGFIQKPALNANLRSISHAIRSTIAPGI